MLEEKTRPSKSNNNSHNISRINNNENFKEKSEIS